MSRFNLPVMKTHAAATPEDLLRLAIHAEEIFEVMLGNRASFDFGLAIFSEELSRITSANQVRDVMMTPEISPEQMVEQVDTLFAAQRLACRQWSFSNGRVPEVLRELLEPRGFHVRKSHLYELKSPRNFARARKDLTVIPGRASFGKLMELDESAERAWGTTSEKSLVQYREAAIRSLDDPQVDNLLALDGQTPVGTSYLVTAGECGLIDNLYVHPHHERKHVATTLLERLIELAARSRLRHLMLFCDDDNTAARALYEGVGFVPVCPAEVLQLPAPDQGPD